MWFGAGLRQQVYFHFDMFQSSGPSANAISKLPVEEGRVVKHRDHRQAPAQETQGACVYMERHSHTCLCHKGKGFAADTQAVYV